MRVFKLLLSIIICVGLLGGVGYGIYNAATTRVSEVSLVIDDQFTDISELIKDYNKIADGETIYLPNSDDELRACGISKEGYTFDCWSYDAKGSNKIEGGAIVKAQTRQTIYLQWKKMDYTVYILTLREEYARNFSYDHYGDVDYYAAISATEDAYKESVEYQGKTTELISGDANIGYVYTWVKWLGNGEYEKDDSGNAVYFSGAQTITGDSVYVRLIMPKKYDVTYKYFDEQGNEKILGQEQLLFNKSSDTIISSNISYGRAGYRTTSYYLKSGENTFDVQASQVINESVLNFVGIKATSFDCFVNYTPRNYYIQFIGFSNGEVITTQGEIEVAYMEAIPYYTNLLTYFNTILTTTNALNRNFLILLNSGAFVYDDNDMEVGENDYMPYCHKTLSGEDDVESPITEDDPLVIRVNYSIKEYNVFFYMQLKDEQVSLQETLNTYRYGSSFDFANDLKTFDYALANNISTQSYSVDEFEFDSYLIQVQDQDDVVVNSLEGLSSNPNLMYMSQDVTIIVRTHKVRFFLEFYNTSVTLSTNTVLIARVEMAFMPNGSAVYINPEDSADLTYKISDIPDPFATNNAQSGDNNKYSFGGWLCVDRDTFGDSAYVNDDYTFYQSMINDDVMVKAEWYFKDTEGNFDGKWSYVLNAENFTATITKYNNYTSYIAIPSAITVNQVNYAVTTIGNGTSSILNTGTSVQKMLIPSSVTRIKSYAFSDNFNNIEVRFEEGGLQELIIEKFAFSSSTDQRANTGVRSVFLPARLTEMEEGVFAYNTNLKNVEISSSNNNYYVENITQTIENVVYTGQIVYKATITTALNGNKEYADREIFAYCSKNQIRDYVIPSDVVRICDYAFSQVKLYTASNLRTVTCPTTNELASIGSYAFAQNAPLEVCDFRSLPHLTSLGIRIFDNSFTSNPTGQQLVDEFVNVAFKYVAFDFNNLTYIPKFMFNQTKSLLGIDLINATNITEIGERAFYDFGISYLNVNGLTHYSDYSFTKIRQGLTTYLLQVYNEPVASNVESSIFKEYLQQYMQSYIILNSLKNVEASAFDTSAGKSMMTCYTNINRIVYSTEMYTTRSSLDNAQLELNAFGSWGILKFKSLHTMTLKSVVPSPNVINKVVIQNATICLQGFDVTLVDMGVQFIDCYFIQARTSDDGSMSFYNFAIVDSDKEDGVDYDFEVTYTANCSSINKITSNIFSGLTIPNSNFVLYVDASITNFGLSQSCLQNMSCKSITITNVSNIANTTFAPAQVGSSQTCEGSAISITFNNCSFVFTVSNVFRDLMFYELARLEKIYINNCPNIINEFYDSGNNLILTTCFKTISRQDGNPTITKNGVNIEVDFTA